MYPRLQTTNRRLGTTGHKADSRRGKDFKLAPLGFTNQVSEVLYEKVVAFQFIHDALEHQRGLISRITNYDFGGVQNEQKFA